MRRSVTYSVANTNLAHMRSKTVPNINENKWQETVDYQDFDLFILEIREGIINKVMNEISKRQRANDYIKYVVNCSYKAWKKIIRIEFFPHDNTNEFYVTPDSSWLPDREPEASVPDSWAAGNTALKPSVILRDSTQIDIDLSDYELIKLTDYPTEHRFGEESSVILQKSETELLRKKSESLTVLYTKIDKSHHSQPSIHFMSSTERVGEDGVKDSNIYLVKSPSEDFFYKLLRMDKESFTFANGKVKKKLPAWAAADDGIETPKKFNLTPLRLNVFTQVKVPPVRHTAIKRVKSTVSEHDGDMDK